MNPMTDAEILQLRHRPAAVGPLVRARRQALFGQDADAIAIAHAPDAAAAEVRDPWPEPSAWHRGDRIVVRIADDDATRKAYVQWLRRLAAADLVGPVSLAPVGADAAGLHRLWCITAARMLLPATFRVEVRHDRVGLRIAQIALGMGADVLAGPIEPDRTLPLAGVTRPTENTAAGLATLVRQAGLRPVDAPPPASLPRDAVASRPAHRPEVTP